MIGNYDLWAEDFALKAVCGSFVLDTLMLHFVNFDVGIFAG